MDTDWQKDLERWLEPFLKGLGNKTRRRMCPVYITGLIGPGERKSIQPMAARADKVSYDRLHHFIGSGVWDSTPLEAALWQQADDLVGGDKAWLIIDDTALPKKGHASVGVAPQYASALGKNANCESAWGPDADRHRKLLNSLARPGSFRDAGSHSTKTSG